MAKILILIVRIYQNTFSLLFPPSCRYTPSCSQYAIDAIGKYGVIKGCYLSVRRVLRCHPLSNHNSYDPV